jgi:hypothetical protein
MAPPIFNATGIGRIDWGPPTGDADRRDLWLTFTDSRGRPLRHALALGGLQITDWTLQEGLYGACDQVRVLDLNLDGGQLDFARYVVQFVRRGRVVGEHAADSVTVRPAT